MQELTNLAAKVKANFKIDYNLEGVKFLEGFIERNKGQIDREEWGGLINSCAAFLGQCIIENYGGSWERDEEGQLAVAFNSQNKVYPFNKVAKQFENGLEDSVYSFYTPIPQVFKLEAKARKKKWWPF